MDRPKTGLPSIFFAANGEKRGPTATPDSRMVMHRTLTAAVLATTLLATAATHASENDPAADAKVLLARGQTREALARLENALPDASADRGAILNLLKTAYTQAIREADAAGKASEAEDFRENLAILSRRSTTAKTADASSAEQPPTPPAPLAESEPRTEPQGVEAEPVTEAAPPSEPPAMAAADAAFRAKNFTEAGRLYTQLAQLGQLPPHRRNPWAYCRMAAVVHQINRGPKSDADWTAIQREIDAIRQVSPKNWYAEYLRNLAIERTSQGRGTARGTAPKILRGASPDEPAPAPLSRDLTPTADPRPLPPAAARQGQAGAPIGNWKVWDTPNFRILHTDDALAEQVARAAETARELQRKRWMDAPEPAAWSPRCDIYIYPDATLFSQATGQAPTSPGFSTMGMNAGRIIARRINLRADHENLLPTILPHEITHVVLADLFSDQQIPRWADEGMAVLAEPAGEQALRAADLDQPLSSGRLFKLADLMVMDYPDGRYWSLYYAQSVSLTRFLVDQGSPAQFVEFVKGSQKAGIDAELQRIYKISDVEALQSRWLAHVKQRSAAVANATAPAGAPDDIPPVRVGATPTASPR
jgi:tetratricopeptide (TPR) repeat protein